MVQINLISLLITLLISSVTSEHTVKEIEEYLKSDYEKVASISCNEANVANWNYETDITDENSQKLVNATLKNAKTNKNIYNEWFNDAKLEDFKDVAVHRQMRALKIIGTDALEEAKLKKLTEILANMTDIYGASKICPFRKPQCDLAKDGLDLEPDIEEIMSSSSDPEELLYAWKAWRNATGKNIRKYYKEYVDLTNEAAKLNNFTDAGHMWRDEYETRTFVEDMDKLWTQVKPLYEKLHKYVSSKLAKKYGSKLVGNDGLIPAHLLGNMWAQSWDALSHLVRPFPGKSSANITKSLIEQNYTARRMFEMSDTFYKSMGLPTNEVSFGPDAMIEKPTGKSVLCHASAWDFCDKKTFRIKMCTKINQEDFITIHHEMGHIQYYLQYKDQPISFRSGANPGFHEAIGDTMALSVSTPQHLEKVGLLKDFKDSEEASLNTLMDRALEKVAFLPFGLLIDKWRWDVFAGNVSENEWNKHWWNYRKEYQKIKAPTERLETDFDPGAKYHVAGDSQYINYFVAHILQFQLYKGLCIAAGQYNPDTRDPPLHKCDFYNSKQAGERLSAGLKLGSSKHWKEVLTAVTGEDKLDASALLEYFLPLSKYLDEQNGQSTSYKFAPHLGLLTLTLCVKMFV